MCSNSKCNEGSDDDIRVLLKIYCWGLFVLLRIYMVFIFLARSRPRDSPISLLVSIQSAIVAERIIKNIFSDLTFIETSGGNIYILVHALFWALFYI